MSNKLRFGSIILVVLLLIGTVCFAVYAQTSSDQGADRFKAAYEGFVSKLAANLGLDQETVKSALEATQKQMLDEAVQQGKMTQEQADRIAQKGYNFRTPSAPSGLSKPGVVGKPQLNGKRDEAMTSILGITSEQLKEELKTGKTMEQIVTEHGLTMEQYNQQVLEFEKNRINQDLADGKITQEQADRMLQNLEKRMQNPQRPRLPFKC